MRIFSLCMAIYIMALSIVPCSDMHNDCNDHSPIHESSHKHNQDIDDHCTPFCSCTCCHTSIVVLDYLPFSFKVELNIIIEQYLSYTNFWLDSNYYGNIWQPPKCNSIC